MSYNEAPDPRTDKAPRHQEAAQQSGKDISNAEILPQNWDIKQKTVWSSNDFEFSHEPVEETIEIKKVSNGYEIRYLVVDEGCQSPRDSHDNMGRMIAYHEGYDLGDKNHGYRLRDYEYSMEELEAEIREDYNVAVILPLYYIETPIGSRMSTKDIGVEVGFIFLEEEDIEREYGAYGYTDGIERATKYLEGEIEEYSLYLEGETYGVVCDTYDEDKNLIDTDSLWGYIGKEWALEAFSEV